MNLSDHEQITTKVEALERAICNYCSVTEDIQLPALFYAHCCGAEAKQLMSEACREIATRDATEAIRRAKEALEALGMTITESDIKARLELAQGQRRAFREMQVEAQKLLVADAGSQAVN